MEKKTEKKGPSYSPFRVPGPTGFLLTFLFLSIGIVLVVLPHFEPTLPARVRFTSQALTASLDTLEDVYALDDPVNEGLFRLNPHSGDTSPSPVATFWALSILQSFGELENRPHLRNAASHYASSLLETIGPDSVALHYVIAVADLSGLELSSQSKSRLYDHLLQLVEPSSGFRANPDMAASIHATFHALETIETLNMINTFSSSENYHSIRRFLLDLQDPDTYGFKDQSGVNATLSATWEALRLLRHFLVSGTDEQQKEVAVARLSAQIFMPLLQLRDGGFAETVPTTARDLYQVAQCSDTARGLHVLYELGAARTSFMDAIMGGPTQAHEYLSACLCVDKGVMKAGTGSQLSLEAFYYLSELLREHAPVLFGRGSFGPVLGTRIFLWIRSMCFGLAAIFFLLATLAWNHHQLNMEMAAAMHRQFSVISCLTIVTVILLHYWSALALLVFMVLITYCGIQFYELLLTDNDGWMIIVVGVNNLCMLGLVMVLTMVAPYVFTTALVFPVLLVWSSVVTFTVTFGSTFFVPKSKHVPFYVSAASMAWVGNVFGTIVLLFNRGASDLQLVQRLLDVRGHTDVVLGILPLLAFSLQPLMAGLAYSLTSEPGKRKAE